MAFIQAGAPVDIARYHPDAIFGGLLKRLPQSLRDWITAGLVLTAWISLFTSTLSVLNDLQSLRDGLTWLVAHSGPLQSALLTVGAWVHAVVEVWRGWTEPLFSFLFGWLPFDVPAWAHDLAVIVLVYIGAWVRGRIFLDVGRQRAFARQASEVAELEAKLAVAKSRVGEAERQLGSKQRSLEVLENTIKASGGRKTDHAQRQLQNATDKNDAAAIREAKKRINQLTHRVNTARKNLAALGPKLLGLEHALEERRRQVDIIGAQIELKSQETPDEWLDLLATARAIRARALILCALMLLLLAIDFAYVAAQTA